MNLIGKPGQSVFDIALQAYGSMEGLSYILADNTSLVELSSPIDKQVVVRKDFYTNKPNVTLIFNNLIPTSE